MSDLDRAAELSAKEQQTRKGRQPYSDELKASIRAAAKHHSKAEIGKRTGLSYPTLQKIIGRTRGRAKKKVAAPKRKPEKVLTVTIQVRLPSGVVLDYDDVGTLRKDAGTLEAAARQVQ